MLPQEVEVASTVTECALFPASRAPRIMLGLMDILPRGSGPFYRILSDESGKGALFAARKLFLVLSAVGCQRSVVTINSRHSIENEIPGSATRIAVDVQILVFYATNYGQRTTSTDFWFGASLPTFWPSTLAKP